MTETDVRVKTADEPVGARTPVGRVPGGDVLVRVEGLKMHFPLGRTRLIGGERRAVQAVDGIDLTIKRGETLGLVGESGCGKSVSAMSLMRLIPTPPGRIVEGEVLFNGQDHSGPRPPPALQADCGPCDLPRQGSDAPQG
jgi:ABC-type glutathione transport system ATPase component